MFLCLITSRRMFATFQVRIFSALNCQELRNLPDQAREHLKKYSARLRSSSSLPLKINPSLVLSVCVPSNSVFFSIGSLVPSDSSAINASSIICSISRAKISRSICAGIITRPCCVPSSRVSHRTNRPTNCTKTFGFDSLWRKPQPATA